MIAKLRLKTKDSWKKRTWPIFGIKLEIIYLQLFHILSPWWHSEFHIRLKVNHFHSGLGSLWIRILFCTDSAGIWIAWIFVLYSGVHFCTYIPGMNDILNFCREICKYFKIRFETTYFWNIQILSRKFPKIIGGNCGTNQRRHEWCYICLLNIKSWYIQTVDIRLRSTKIISI